MRAGILVALCALAAAGCTPNKQPDGQVAGPTPAESNTMEDSLAHLAEHASLTVSIRTGTEHWKLGQITLTLRGDGQAQVVNLRAGERLEFSSQLEPDEVARVGKLLARHKLTLPRTSKLPRKPGDTPVELTLRDGDDQLSHVQIWYADRFKDADLDAILRESDRLVHKVSAGELGSP